MVNLKIDELICLTTWGLAFVEGNKDSETNATEKEKNITRAMRAFFKMDVDRFNDANSKNKSARGHFEQLSDKDIITKIACIYGALKVGWLENEGLESENLSDKEWDYVKEVISISKLPDFIRKDIQKEAYAFINEIAAPKYLKDADLINLIDFEKDDGVIYERSIKPLLKVLFNSLEKNNLYDTWEDNYFGILKHKTELEELYGFFQLKDFDDRYKELKPLISNYKKEKAQKEKQLANEKEVKEKQLAKEIAQKEKQLAKEKEAREKQLAKEKAEIEKQLAKEKAEEEKNKTHEFSVSNGIYYCRFCGYDKGFSSENCCRENGHKYSVKRVEKISFYSGKHYEFEPVCTKCGYDKGYSKHKCS